MLDELLRHVRCVACGYIITATTLSLAFAESGCSRQASDAGFPDTRMAACFGRWQGHVKFSTELCAAGWDVCSWDVDSSVLGKVSWNVALSVDGCFAYNAAQDGGRCRECQSELDQDDLAGMGRGCPHQHISQGSCISGGRIDASCCVDSHISINTACQQQPWIDGVMCCKQSAKRPHIIVPPPGRLEVNVGRIFMLTCQAEGVPSPRVQWYKDGAKLPNERHSRVSTLLSGDLLVTLSKHSDSGQYTCEVINEEGIDIAHTQVFVKDHDSGCRDDTTDGLLMHRDIHACQGQWKGHVKEGESLCKRGWRVCNHHDKERLKDLSWLDILDMDGCFAYNVANTKRGKCKRCHAGEGRLAGVGRECGRVRYSRPSCLSQGRIDVYRGRDVKNTDDSCSYAEGHTTGVLCCKREKNYRHAKKKDRRKNEISTYERPHCSLGCENGGQCVGYNVCMCPVGYKGAMCQNAVCPSGCGRRARCVRPGVCECIQPYSGKNCSEKPIETRCKLQCLNGGQCRRGACKCPPHYSGSRCQTFTPTWKHHTLLSKQNRTER
ncbi:uncharacterized protein LOC128210189 [Mya arenaria]|nr:uncharacterized protein LOC128210189 [Mya arenaria]